MNVRLPEPLARLAGHPRLLRYFAAAVAAACAAVYFLIGLGFIYDASDQRLGLFIFGMSAGFAFALGSVLLLATERRIVWVLGALFQVFVIVAYFNVAKNRNPPFEVWGLSLKVAQVAILGALAALVMSPRRSAPNLDEAAGRGRTEP